MEETTENLDFEDEPDLEANEAEKAVLVPEGSGNRYKTLINTLDWFEITADKLKKHSPEGYSKIQQALEQADKHLIKGEQALFKEKMRNVEMLAIKDYASYKGLLRKRR